MNRRIFALVIAAIVPLGLLLVVQISVSNVEAATTWTVGVDPECPTIQDCVDNASVLDGDTIHIPTGVYTEQVVLGKELAIRGEGPEHTIVNADQVDRVFWVTADAAAFEDLTVTGGMVAGNPDRGAGIYSFGALTLTNVTVVDNILVDAVGSGAGVYGHGNVTINDSLFLENQCNSSSCIGGGLYVSSLGEARIVNTDFISNTATKWGGGIIRSFGTITVIGGRFEGNSADGIPNEAQGGGIYADRLVMSGTVLIGNEAVSINGLTGRGGAIYAASFILTDTTLADNYAPLLGGAIFGNGRITEGRLEGNSSNLGGAISGRVDGEPYVISGTTFVDSSQFGFYVYTDTTIINSHFDSNDNFAVFIGNSSIHLTMTNSIVENTHGQGIETIGSALIEGSSFISNSGGLKSQGLLRIIDSSFLSNTATVGAGIDGNTIHVSDSLFAYNVCPTGCGQGAGFYARAGAYVTNTDFLSNTTYGLGAGFYAAGDVVVKDSLFQGNQAFDPGAGASLVQVNGDLTIDNTEFIGNQSMAGGGAISSGSVQVSHSLFEENSGGALGGQTVIITSSDFISNTSLYGASGVQASNIDVFDSLFEDNTCSDASCGGTAITVVGEAQVISSTFRGGQASAHSAAIYTGGSLRMTDSLIVDNRCTGSTCVGGAIVTIADALISDTQIIRNTSQNGGGAIYALEDLFLTKSLIEDNHCTASGCFGGAAHGAVVTVETSTIISNASQAGGGALDGDAFTIRKTSFEANSCLAADCQGGAVHSSGPFWAEQSLFEGNHSQSVGGAVSAAASGSPDTPVTLINILLADNTSGGEGAALHFDGGSSGTIIHTTIAGSSPISGSAIFVLGSNVAISNTIIAGHEVGLENGGLGDVSEDYNLYFGNLSNISGTVTSGANSLVGDPDFIEPAVRNYRLGVDSAAIDNALDLGVLFDLDGVSRPLGPAPDRGAYETSLVYFTYLPLLLKSG